MEEKPRNLIEAIIRNSLGEKRNNDIIYDSENILNEFGNMFVAGADTTSSFLTMMIYLIVQHP